MALAKRHPVYRSSRCTPLPHNRGSLHEVEGAAASKHELDRISKYEYYCFQKSTYFWLVDIQFKRHRELWLRTGSLFSAWTWCSIVMGHVAGQIRVIDVPDRPIGISWKEKLVPRPANSTSSLLTKRKILDDTFSCYENELKEN